MNKKEILRRLDTVSPPAAIAACAAGWCGIVALGAINVLFSAMENSTFP